MLSRSSIKLILRFLSYQLIYYVADKSVIATTKQVGEGGSWQYILGSGSSLSADIGGICWSASSTTTKATLDF